MKILLTGVSSGIGLFLAEALHEDEVWGLARRSPPTTAGIHFSHCDVTDWDAVERVAVDIRTKWKYLDAIIHCAGTQGAVGEAMNLDPAEWVRTVRANVEGAYFVLRAFFLLLQSSPTRSKAILFSGGGASKPRPNFSAYGCAKAALVRLAETLSEEWKQFAIDINIIAPGAINTAMTSEVVDLGAERSGLEEHARAVKQLSRGGDPIENVYLMVRFLLSRQSDGITGKFLSAQWDEKEKLRTSKDSLTKSDLYTLRRITPEGRVWKQ
jgi:NAD(P)-dependent dehydrogenase (short-subunit alcohol dehydrogenase family)